MPKLYLFPIEAESRDLARRYSEQIVDEINRAYPLCKYLEPVQVVNISSEVNGIQFVQFEPELPSAFQVNDVVIISQNVGDLVSIVKSCLNGKGVKHKSPLEFPL